MILDGLDHLPVFDDRLLDPLRQGPSVKSNDMGLGPEKINHVVEVAVMTASEYGPMETSPPRKDRHEGHGILIRDLTVQVAHFLVDQDDDIRLSEARWNQLS